MQISILAFGIARDILGTSTFDMEIKDGQTVAEIVDELKSKYAAFNKLNSVLLAVNEDYVDDDYIVQQGDELAIIPPVSGG
ncbi:molybdopterin converting factor subunit 1 [Reichenbachiella agarivorans]|uniref:Molybdopterin synthase sulfur carrier subunit n=1 Tax=Reichenbachiella agarivorans TaxID=2979464 RepID=A0ABY6CPL9_9BACT|nr:molybdopterin converting factor subunit 1 [Reichenbachiella agarivorans]UXP32467.1 molybdopterin converting factor subunit 1 [Reichenbachiella agarivorans]